MSNRLFSNVLGYIGCGGVVVMGILILFSTIQVFFPVNVQNYAENNTVIGPTEYQLDTLKSPFKEIVQSVDRKANCLRGIGANDTIKMYIRGNEVELSIGNCSNKTCDSRDFAMYSKDIQIQRYEDKFELIEEADFYFYTIGETKGMPMIEEGLSIKYRPNYNPPVQIFDNSLMSGKLTCAEAHKSKYYFTSGP
jgi:hypothetical protein